MKQQLDAYRPQLLADLADLLELLSIGLTPPTPGLAAALRDESYCSDLSACLSGLSSVLDADALNGCISRIAGQRRAFALEEDDALYHSINQTYTRLFIAPRREQMPLYESLIVHRDDGKVSMFINPTCMHAEQLYRKSGFPFPEKSRIPGDHVAIELRYAAYLLSLRIAAGVSQDDHAAGRAGGMLEEFISGHLVRWYRPFMQELRAAQAHPFYTMIADAALTCMPALLP